MKKKFLKSFLACSLLFFFSHSTYGWGFWGHKKINHMACFTLPPGMVGFYKSHIDFITDHAVDPDNRRYSNKAEPPRHYLDADHYGDHPFDSLPKFWKDAVAKYSEDTLNAYGINPWYITKMMFSLTESFKDKDVDKILYYSANIGHYIADGHVPLHCTENYNGQMTGQVGIHAFWESRIPELSGDHYDFLVGRCMYIPKVQLYTWTFIEASFAALDSVFRFEKELGRTFPPDKKFSFEQVGNKTQKVYSADYAKAYEDMLSGMVERRLRASVFDVGSLWYTAWVNAGSPDLDSIGRNDLSDEMKKKLEEEEKASHAGEVKEIHGH
ncbi:MAG: zinc dependent phospholipase C family protein [Bacteroidetes bacterium]|nr:zinc dependent phospholipase C family protein [Bacteroidota bacterium]